MEQLFAPLNPDVISRRMNLVPTGTLDPGHSLMGQFWRFMAER